MYWSLVSVNGRQTVGMKKISMRKLENLAEDYGLVPCRIRGTDVIQIRKHDKENLEDISWEEFLDLLEERGLSVYKDERSDFLKIMKDR
jgi:hypothetical protein